MFIFSKFVEISYCSTLDCPSEGKSFGAQIDLKSNSSIASYINLTNGNAEYCCGIEYRDSESGYFKFQTFCTLTGCFLTSFIGFYDIEISYCNYVNDTIEGTLSYSALIYTRKSNVAISNFCLFGIKIFGKCNFVFFLEDESCKVMLTDSIIEQNLLNYMTDVITDNVQIYDENSDKFTNTLHLLDLGECRGEITPPPLILDTKIFSNSNIFTKSCIFSKSEKFSASNILVNKFSSSKIFSESHEFLEFDHHTSINSLTTIPNEVTFHKSYSLTIVNVKTVVFSLSQIGSYSYFLSYCPEMNTFLYSISYSKFHKNFPYIIFSISPSFVQTYFVLEIARSSKISPEKLIGITCGSTAGFFIILSIIFFIIQKRKKINENSLTDSSEISSDDTQNIKEHEVLNSTPNILNKDDSWL